MKSESNAGQFKPIPGGYLPLSILWSEVGGEPARFPSEASARWFIREHYTELAEAGALAIERRRLFIHPERFDEARGPIAVRLAKSRCAQRAAA